MAYGMGPVAVGSGMNWAAPYTAAANYGYNFASPWYAQGDLDNFAMPYAAGTAGGNFAGVPYGAGVAGAYW